LLGAIFFPLVVCGPVAASPRLAAPASRASAQARITADWVAFFSGSTPVSRRIALLQDGGTFATVVKALTASPLAKIVGAKVTGVTLNSSATKATVHYALTLGGKPALSNMSGEAVLQNGTWKVADESFCGLLALEQMKAAGCSG
jgi:hypothetical protein